jgi:hypothetical protein
LYSTNTACSRVVSNSILFPSRDHLNTPSDEGATSNQHRGASDLFETAIPDGSQVFQFNPSVPVLDDLLGDHITALANWEYFQFAWH